MKPSRQQRREKVSFYLTINKTETEIAEILGVSRRTVVRDIQHLKGQAPSWLDGLTEILIFEYKLVLDKLKVRSAELQTLKELSGAIYEKLQIIREQTIVDKMYLDIISGTPTIHSLRKVIRETTDVRAAQKRT